MTEACKCLKLGAEVMGEGMQAHAENTHRTVIRFII